MSISEIIINAYTQSNRRVLKVVEELTDAQLTWKPDPGAHSIAFILWHLARWADHLHEALPNMSEELGRRLGPSPQIWRAEGLAAKWELDPAALAHEETGMLMKDADAAALALPEKAILLDYSRRTFAAGERAVRALDDVEMLAEYSDQTGRDMGSSTEIVGNTIMVHLTHINRHLGEIEYIRGLQGMKGSATV